MPNAIKGGGMAIIIKNDVPYTVVRLPSSSANKILVPKTSS